MVALVRENQLVELGPAQSGDVDVDTVPAGYDEWTALHFRKDAAAENG